jgi:predicted dehydrogenase
MKQYRCVIVGCGKVGMEYAFDDARVVPRSHIENVIRHSATELTAVVETDKVRLTRLESVAAGVRAFTDLRSCLSITEPDIVIVASPTASHANAVLMAIEASVPMILCEKPLGNDANEAAAIAEAVRKSDCKLVLNYQRRFFPLLLQVRDGIRGGRIGQIQQISACYSNGLYNNAGHLLDTISFLIDARAVSASGTFNAATGEGPEGDRNIDGFVQFENNARAALHSFDQRSYALHEMTIYGTNGLVAIAEHGYSIAWKKVAITAGIPSFETEEVKRHQVSFVEGALKELVECYEVGRDPASGIKNGLDVLCTLDALVQSAANRGILVPMNYSMDTQT